MSEGGASGPKKKSETDFLFGRVIGEGSFSTVYLARDRSSLKEVAIKMCSKEQVIREKKQQAIMREKEVMNKITCNWNKEAPFFVRLMASFHDARSLFFVMTLGKRGDMFRFIKKMAAKEVDVTQFYAAELVQALQHLHSLNIVHRDLKPENILLDAGMHILVTDFGSAKLLEEEPESSEEQGQANCNGEEGDRPSGGRRSSFVGTAQYVSPEVLTGQDTSPASDLWALGCILYQMVTGMCPFVSQTEYLIFQKIQALDYTFPEGFDSRVKDLVTRLLVIDPEKRLGALESRSGYTSIKNHPFFEGVDFSTLHLSTPPGVEVSSLRDSKDPVWAKYPDMMPGLGAGALDRMLRYEMEDGRDSDSGSDNGGDDVESEAGSEIGDIGNIGDISDEERLRLLDLQKQNNEYHRFVDGNLILKQGILDKKKGLWSRRRMFLLTEGPKLFYVDPKEKVLKGEIPWSADMKTEMKDFRIFFVHTPGRVYYLIDPASFATKWCEAIESVRNFYFPNS